MGVAHQFDKGEKFSRFGKLLSKVCTWFLKNCVTIDEIIEEECKARMEFKLSIKLQNLKGEISHCAVLILPVEGDHDMVYSDALK